MSEKINTTVLMSSAAYFDNSQAINPYMDTAVGIDGPKAQFEHQHIKQALESAGITVVQVEAPIDCQDGVYAANWGLCRGNRAILSSLPPVRQAESTHAKQVLESLGKEVIAVPNGLRFSGQGDALPCGNLLFAGQTYRTDVASHDFIAQELGYQVIGLHTVPQYTKEGRHAINSDSGWPDSFFYDIDLALAVLSPNLIAWCPEAFMPDSQEKLRSLDIAKIEVSHKEAVEGFACNLVSTGKTVIMGDRSPRLESTLQQYGFKTITVKVDELKKGGGYIRCTTLTLDNA